MPGEFLEFAPKPALFSLPELWKCPHSFALPTCRNIGVNAKISFTSYETLCRGNFCKKTFRNVGESLKLLAHFVALEGPSCGPPARFTGSGENLAQKNSLTCPGFWAILLADESLAARDSPAG